MRALLLAIVAAGLIGADHCDALAANLARQARLHARRTGRFASLSGAWSGEYRYGAAARARPVPFNALLEEAGEALSGTIDEPNTFADPAAPRLFATLAGTRKGCDVRFTKRYSGVGGATHAIAYAGLADAELTRIDGSWTAYGMPSGAFFMERTGAGAEAAAERATSAEQP